MGATGFVGRQVELSILTERFVAAEMGYPQVVYLEGEAGSGKSTLLSRFLGTLPNAVIVQAGGDEDEVLLSYGVIDQLEPGALTEPGADPMAVGVSLLELLDRLQSDGQVGRPRRRRPAVGRPTLVARPAVRSSSAQGRQGVDGHLSAGRRDD